MTHVILILTLTLITIVMTGGSIIVKQLGHAILTVTLPTTVEEYLITLPRLRIDGLWYGSPYIELVDNSCLVGSTGWVGVVEYKGKGYFSGKSHSFKATLSPPGVSAGDKDKNGSNGTYVVEGLWHETSKFTKGKGVGKVFHDVTGTKEKVTVRAVAEQSEWESRKLWEAVAKGIREGDFESASREKGKIEVGVNRFFGGM